MERLAGRIILLWGWRRALVAFLAGALAVLAQAPYDFFAAGFVSFPLLVWLLDGATGEASDELAEAPAAGLCRRLVVRLRLFPRRPVVDRRGAAGRGRQFRLGACPSRSSAFRCCWPSSTASPRSSPGCCGPTTSAASPPWPSALAWRNGCAASCSPAFPGIRRLCGDAGAAADAERVGDRHDRHERAGGLRLRHAGAACRTPASAPRRWSCLPLLVAAHAGFGYVRLAPPDEPATRTLDVRIVQPDVDLSGKMGRLGARPHLRHHDGPFGRSRRNPARQRRSSSCGRKPRCRSCSPSGRTRWPRSATCCSPARC